MTDAFYHEREYEALCRHIHGPECVCFPAFLGSRLCDHCRDWKEPTEPILEIVLTRQVGWHTARGVRVVGEPGLWHFYYRKMPHRLMAKLTKAQKEAVYEWGRWGTNSQGLSEEDPTLT